MANNELTSAVTQKVKSATADAPELSLAVREAMRLCDLYKDVTPETYVPPLERMAGFFSPQGK